MQINDKDVVIAVVKNEEQGPIPSAWRSVIRHIVDALAHHDYQLAGGIPGVAPVSANTGMQIQGYIERYGETVVPLPDETWETSVCIWTGHHWDVMIDLWTAQEGCSDLVLALEVHDTGDDVVFYLHMVYVP
ncbi:DUF7668 domain-containing protein [Massilia aquatica]|uniref:DUF7668 domain-containing protein n=1 Tax=Massilia aquatica TaxID=2609000 RepID=A0ABX0LXI0_9BURK|nr:hypothetical protein [Massilia aquatica]NHZ39530.1 hypothetical protein [Massilia aquatica]